MHPVRIPNRSTFQTRENLSSTSTSASSYSRKMADPMPLLHFMPSATLYLLVFKPPRTSSGTIITLMMLCCRNEYAIFKQIKTETITVEGDAKKAKLFITLEKHPKFDENYKKFEDFKLETAPATKQ